MKKLFSAVCLVALAAFFHSPAAHAELVTLTFQRVTTNSTLNLSPQLFVDVLDKQSAASQYNRTIGDTDVLFIVRNTGSVDGNASIKEIYFDDGIVLGLSQVINSQDFSGVAGIGGSTSFNAGSASPGDLPGGELLNPDFVVTAGFLADSGKGGPTTGLDQSNERLGIVFTTKPPSAELPVNGYPGILHTLLTGDLRVGLHICAIDSDDKESDSYVNSTPTFAPPPPPVPEPSSLVLIAIGGAFGVFRGRRILRR